MGNYRKPIIEKKNSRFISKIKRNEMFPILGRVAREGKRWQIGFDTAKMLEDNGEIYY